jgi:putative transposase
MRYRRYYMPGASYFFTIALVDRKSQLLIEEIDLLRSVIKYVRSNHEFRIDAIVILPDHIHMIMTLPENDSLFSKRISLIKSSFSRKIKKNEIISSSRKSKRERGLWQRRFWEHAIRNDLDFENHVNYIHYNPVKHGLVQRVVDWPYSSFHKFVRDGILPRNWCAEGLLADIDNE